MSKESIIDEVLRVIYSSKSKTTLTKNQVKLSVRRSTRSYRFYSRSIED